MKTLIIGGGAAGLAAAVAAAEIGDRVLLLERMDRVGKKLLATGNGRCNLMNTGAPRYPGGMLFAQQVLSACGQAEQTRFWQALGLSLREEREGRVYPASGQASTVLDTLRFALEEHGVETVTGVRAQRLHREDSAWRVETNAGRFAAERVIVACGGQAQPKLGSDGSGYTLLTQTGHRLLAPRAALTPIETDTAPIAGLAGIRVRCALRLMRQGKPLHTEAGELLFADYGVSGVCVMQCARDARPGDELAVDLRPAMGLDEAAELMEVLLARQGQWPERPVERLLTGLCVPRLSAALLRAANVSARERRLGDLKKEELARIAAQIGCFRLRVKGIRGFEAAQVTAGGIDPADFAPETLASRKAPGLHAAGELLAVDGDCGGFNLMFAFGSGILAGLNGRPAPWTI